MFVLAVFFVSLIEIGRTPFDLVERESELVSRYNIEFGGLRFTFLFLGEYLRLVFFGLFFVSYFPLHISTWSERFFASVLIVFFLVLIRAWLPRYKFFRVVGMT